MVESFFIEGVLVGRNGIVDMMLVLIGKLLLVVVSWLQSWLYIVLVVWDYGMRLGIGLLLGYLL